MFDVDGRFALTAFGGRSCRGRLGMAAAGALGNAGLVTESTLPVARSRLSLSVGNAFDFS